MWRCLWMVMWQCLWIATTWLVLVNCWCLAGMGDPPGQIYPPWYGSGENPPPITVYGDTCGVILLSWGWVWKVHTRWGFTHCQREVRPNWFLSISYVPCKPCIYLASRLALSPNIQNWAFTWAPWPRSTIGCVQNGFLSYGALGANRAPILHRN